ncbi:S-adenosyl-L-methionine-dependent methyltransferase [Hypomontagnella monticulosa]|nr:S-adenosyl-L-methionine-dependent methyltransferase [Hypomontagnella monticulosa]
MSPIKYHQHLNTLRRGTQLCFRPYRHYSLALNARSPGNKLAAGFQSRVIGDRLPGGLKISARYFSATAGVAAPEQQGDEDSENFWRVSADDSKFWDDYVSTRPKYSVAFYDKIYSHHAAHSSSWEIAHDVGCGAGQVSAELASRFKHVVASDMNDTHIAVAQRRLTPTLGPERLSFTHCMGEHLVDNHPPGSADLVAIAEAMVLMDEHVALESFSRLLRSGGTLAFWFYGRPTFSDPKLRAEAQPLIDEIMVRNWSKVIRGSGERRIAGFQRAAEGMASWLDYVPLDPETWTDVRRIKWNPSATLPFFGEEACGFPIKSTSNVTPKEHTEEHEDPEWWRNDWDLAELKKYFSVLFPGFKQAVGDGDAEINRLFEQLKVHFGGEGKIKQFTWPAVLVTATRK